MSEKYKKMYDFLTKYEKNMMSENVYFIVHFLFYGERC